MASTQLPGSSLIAHHTRLGGGGGRAEVLRVARTALTLLAMLGRAQLVHRDISLDNIVAGEHGRLWLVDFDSAVDVDECRRTQALDTRFECFTAMRECGRIRTVPGATASHS